MATQKKNLGKPDESRQFPKGKMDVVKVGDVFVCTPGHDAWIVGKEPCDVHDFAGAATYAKKA